MLIIEGHPECEVHRVGQSEDQEGGAVHYQDLPDLDLLHHAGKSPHDVLPLSPTVVLLGLCDSLGYCTYLTVSLVSSLQSQIVQL